ncbi:MAG: TMEM175 family protein, partial [Cyanobacteria bacterium J06626_18]
MEKGRLEAFSDGVLAIIITIMVLEFEVPETAELTSLQPLFPKILSYVLSYLYLGIYWNNHHHLLQATRRVNGRILWANLHLLFWLSLIPFATAWMGENRFATIPVALYGFVLLASAVAYSLLSRTLTAHRENRSILAKALGKDLKGKLSIVIYVVAIPLAFATAWIACALYVLAAAIWLIPDRRIENTVAL